MDKRDPEILQSVQDEMRRLEERPRSGEVPGPAGTERFVAKCMGNAEEVLYRCKDVLRVVLGRSTGTWPSAKEWEAALPSWFVSESAPEESLEEAQRYAEWFRQLPPTEQLRAAKEDRWSVAGWVSWMHPQEREWWWWDGRVEDPDTLVVDVQVDDWPHAVGALEWLLRASGATSIESRGQSFGR